MMVSSSLAGRVGPAVLIAMLLAVGGCAQLGRLGAVAANDTGRASVLGIREARFFSNETDAITAVARRLYDREVKYYGSLGRPIPPENILALSGGGDNGAFGA